MRKIKALIFYYLAEENSTLSYQTGWPEVFRKSDLFDSKFINLRDQVSKNISKLFINLFRKEKIEIIICLHSVFSNQNNMSFPIRKIIEKTNIPKAFFIGNEYKLMPEKLRFINKLKFDLVFSQTNNINVHELYKTNLNANIEWSPNCLVEKEIFNYKMNFNERPITIGYRSYASPFYTGNNERVEIANFFKIFADQKGLTSDISLDPQDRFNSKDYAKFLNKCKFQIGTEAGTDYFELTDATRYSVNSYLDSRQADWSEIYELFFRSKKKLPLRLITGRNIEAAACGTIQLLFEGEYNGFLKPDIHYIELKKDFSNINEVEKRMNDNHLLKEIRKNCFNLVNSTFKDEIILKNIYKVLLKYISED